MRIGLRSYLITGTAALVGTSSVMLTPVVAPNGAPVALRFQSAAELTLTGFDNPLTELLATLDVVNRDLVGTGTYAYPFPLSTGIVPQAISDALPIIRQLGYNGSDYVDNSVEQLFTGPTSASVTLANAAWSLLPDIAASGLQPAFAKLAKEINEAGQTALAAGVYVLTGVMNRLIPNIGGLLTYIVPNLLSASLGAVSAVASAVGKVATQFVEAVISLNPEAAWNVAVDGLFGPIGADGTVASSIPGTLEAVTIGNGLGLYGSQSYVSSLRVAVQGAVYSVANNLGGSFPRPTTPLVPTPSATTAAAAAVPAAEAVTTAAAPAAPAAEAITAAAPAAEVVASAGSAAEVVASAGSAAEVVASAGSAAAAAETLPAVGATIDGTPRSAVGRTLGARGTGIRTAESGSGGTAASGAAKAPRAAAAAPGRGDQRTSE
jgi:hypothetical protein